MTAVRSIPAAAAATARVLVVALLAVCLGLAVVVGAALVAPDAVEPLWRLPYASETAFTFVVLAPMLAGIPVAWGLLALGRRVWRRHALLAWPIGVLVFTVTMDLLPAKIWQHSVPFGDRMPGTPNPTLVARMGDFLAVALAGGLVVATLWWLLLDTRLSRRPAA